MLTDMVVDDPEDQADADNEVLELRVPSTGDKLSSATVAINITSTMLGYVYGTQSVILDVHIFINIDASRLFLDGIELMIIIVGTFAQALSGEGHAVSIVGVLVVWRFLMSVGIGGDYQALSAVIEFASTRIRGRIMTAVFSARGWGTLGELLLPTCFF
ncbi:hypothetical protein H0H93_004146 [Arthromyces matolae]|nr:hypothetical protein H0H93_004146 [Arthromyces matolae]